MDFILFLRSIVAFLFVFILVGCSRSNDVNFVTGSSPVVADCDIPSSVTPFLNESLVFALSKDDEITQVYFNDFDALELALDRNGTQFGAVAVEVEPALEDVFVFFDFLDIGSQIELRDGSFATVTGVTSGLEWIDRNSLLKGEDSFSDEEDVAINLNDALIYELTYRYELDYIEADPNCKHLGERLREDDDSDDSEIISTRTYEAKRAYNISFVQNSDTSEGLIGNNSYLQQDGFLGQSVSSDGFLLAIGFPYDDSGLDELNPTDNPLSDSGVVKLFARNSVENGFEFCGQVKASNARANDYFGSKVLVRDGVLYVSAHGEDSTGVGVYEGAAVDQLFAYSSTDSGAVYKFDVDVQDVTQCAVDEVAYFKSPRNDTNGASTDTEFGTSIAVFNGEVFIGAPRQQSLLQSGSTGLIGEVYGYRKEFDGSWASPSIYTSSARHNNERFGDSISAGRYYFAIGAPGDGVDNSSFSSPAVTSFDDIEIADDLISNSGSVYLYSRDSADDFFLPLAYLKPKNVDSGDRFGSSVSVVEREIFVGAPFEDGSSSAVNVNGSNNTLANAGAVYRFSFDDDDNFVFSDYIKSRQPAEQANFGAVISAERKFLAVANDAATQDFGQHGVTNSHVELINYTSYDDPRYLSVFEDEASMQPLDARVESIDLYGGTLVLGLPEATLLDENSNPVTNAGAFAVWE